MVYEEPCAHDPEAVTLLFTAFNRWLEEDWGFAYQDRIFAAPYLTLVDVDWACRELEWALDHGARTIVMRPAAPTTHRWPALARRPRTFDPFWARVERGRHHDRRPRRRQRLHRPTATPATGSAPTSGWRAVDARSDPHAAAGAPDRGLPRRARRREGSSTASRTCGSRRSRTARASCAACSSASRSCPTRCGLVPRGPGGDVPPPHLDQPVLGGRRRRGARPHGDRPGDLRLDWPHIEALPEPLDYLQERAHLEPEEQRKILLDNTAGLNELSPV